LCLGVDHQILVWRKILNALFVIRIIAVAVGVLDPIAHRVVATDAAELVQCQRGNDPRSMPAIPAMNIDRSQGSVGNRRVNHLENLSRFRAIAHLQVLQGVLSAWRIARDLRGGL
jgi:hypothetical protein